MATPHQLARLRRRADALEAEPPATGAERPDPTAVTARALGLLQHASLAAALGLAALTCAGVGSVGAVGAAALTGTPAALLGLSWWAGRAPRRRRVAMVAATSTAGFLALATVGSLASLGATDSASLYQVAAFALAATLLALAWPAWRRVEREGSAARAALALYEEL